MKQAILVLGLLGAGAETVVAHDDATSVFEFRVSGRTVIWIADVGLGSLGKAVELPASWADLTEQGLQSVKPAIAAYLASRSALFLDGVKVAPEIGPLEAVTELSPFSGQPYVARARQEFRFQSERAIRSMRIESRLFSELTAMHRSMVSMTWGDRGREFLMLGPSQLEVTREALEAGRAGDLGPFVLWGMQRLFQGLPSLAFLLALVLATRGSKRLAGLFAAFAAAHTITLVLGALGLIRLPDRIAQILIASSVIYVALENLFLPEGRHRWAPVYCFGLAHGIGFASTLRGLLPDRSPALGLILGFDLGLVLAELAFLALLYPAALWLRSRAKENDARPGRLVWAGSAMVLLAGLAWLAERAIGLRLIPGA